MVNLDRKRGSTKTVTFVVLVASNLLFFFPQQKGASLLYLTSMYSKNSLLLLATLVLVIYCFSHFSAAEDVEEVIVKRECPFKAYRQATDALSTRANTAIAAAEANSELSINELVNGKDQATSFFTIVWNAFKGVASGKMRAVSYVNMTSLNELKLYVVLWVQNSCWFPIILLIFYPFVICYVENVVLLKSVPHKPSLIVINANYLPKRKRQANENFITIENVDLQNTVFGTLFVPLMNKLGEKFEQVAKRNFYKVSIAILPEAVELVARETDPNLCAMFDVASTTLYLKPYFFNLLKEQALENVQSVEVDAQGNTIYNKKYLQVVRESFEAVIRSIPSELSKEQLEQFIYKMPEMFRQSIEFCVACTVVLAVAVPFLFNFGFVGIANLICKHFKSDADTCETLWWTSISLAYVMIIPAAFAIVKVCNLTTCGQSAIKAVKIGTLTIATVAALIRKRLGL